MKIKCASSVPLSAVFQHVAVGEVEAATVLVVSYKILEAAATRERGGDGKWQTTEARGPSPCHAQTVI